MGTQKICSVSKALITDGEPICPNVLHLQRSKQRTVLSAVVVRGQLAVFARRFYRAVPHLQYEILKQLGRSNDTHTLKAGQAAFYSSDFLSCL